MPKPALAGTYPIPKILGKKEKKSHCLLRKRKKMYYANKELSWYKSKREKI